MKSRFDFNSVSEITGAFVILTVVLVAGLITMTARVQRWFEPVYELTIQLPPEEDFPTGAEVLQDAPVLIAATTVGSVKEILVLEEEGIVLATLQIQGDLIEGLRANAKARISLPFLAFLGEASIKITNTSRSGPALFGERERKARLKEPARADTDLQEQLREWNDIALEWNAKAEKWEVYFDEWNVKAHKWEVYFDDWNQVAHEWEVRMASTFEKIDRELDTPNGKVHVFLDNLNLLLDHLANEGLLEWATRDPEWNQRTKNLIDSVERGTQDAARIAELVEAILAGDRPLPAPFGDTFAELPGMAQRVSELLERVSGVVAQIELASRSFPVIADSIENDVRTIPGFLIESQETLRQIEIMVRALQRHWLLRSYVDPRPAKGRIPVEEAVGPLGGQR